GTTTSRSKAVKVPGLSGVSMVAVGGGSQTGTGTSLALKTDGTLWQWGATLGDSTPKLLPVQIPGITGTVTSIAVGEDHALLLKSDGTVWALGKNADGQLGDGTTTARAAPVQVVGLTGITAIAAGDS